MNAVNGLPPSFQVLPQDQNLIRAEYIWLDGYKTPNLRSKVQVLQFDTATYTKIVENLSPTEDSTKTQADKEKVVLDLIPTWGSDGSSTLQAKGKDSDIALLPVRIYRDPFNMQDGLLIFCEVAQAITNEPHPSNQRAKLRNYLDAAQSKDKLNPLLDAGFIFAFEQEYFIFDPTTGKPYKWSTGPFLPPEQGRFYCGIGGDVAWGRPISDYHLKASWHAGVPIFGTNGEVAPSQWEYATQPADCLRAGDNLWISRFILNRIAEMFDLNIRLDPKPYVDYNGNGGHTNFSTKMMRDCCPPELIKVILDKMRQYHTEHIAVYGSDNNKRLTGKYETCHIDEFRGGSSDRSASIRIPVKTLINNGQDGGYLEDRRPAGNIDPYPVIQRIVKTVHEAQEEYKTNIALTP